LTQAHYTVNIGVMPRPKEKTERVDMRVRKDDKDLMWKFAKKRGFDGITAYLLWLFRNDSQKD